MLETFLLDFPIPAPFYISIYEDASIFLGVPIAKS